MLDAASTRDSLRSLQRVVCNTSISTRPAGHQYGFELPNSLDPFVSDRIGLEHRNDFTSKSQGCVNAGDGA